MSTIEFVDRRGPARSAAANRVLTQAALAAGAAPAVHGRRPWRWRIDTGLLQLRRDDRPDPRAFDPDGRRTTVSCGAALHHALVGLAAAGAQVQVDRLPDPADGRLLAEVRVTGFTQPSAAAIRRRQAVTLRHTMRSAADQEVPEQLLGVLREVVAAQGARLVVLGCPATAAVAGRGDAGTSYSRLGLVYACRDDTAGWLAAGEAMSAVLIEAPLLRLVATPEADLPGTWQLPDSGRGSVAAIRIAAPRVRALPAGGGMLAAVRA